ncbi:MAG: 3,4-dihydroxy-2-butanone-4-phosphate synthase [Actinobacteria bacterium]|nr:3,4-dihydroxy-2-butanone-4-phosphate synthase [Actinomycetota bacterium]
MASELEKAMRDFRRGGFVIVTDDADRENEGDLFLLASAATTEKIGFMIRHTSGVICVAMTEERSRQLHLPLMVRQNQDTKRTAFTVTVDVKHGITTGISAEERANTIRALADATSSAEDFVRPGHIFPLIAHEGGLAARRGHTEAVVEMCYRAGATPAGVISELVNDDGSMMRGQSLRDFASEHSISMITIEELSRSLAPSKKKVSKEFDWARLPLAKADWRIATHSGQGGVTHAVLALGELDQGETLVRIHSECLTGDVLGSMRCDCGNQLASAMEEIEKFGSGLVIYLREHEGRGIGLSEKIRAYRLQDEGLDTVDANLALGHEIDERDFQDAVEILNDLGIEEVLLLTNNPAKVKTLQEAKIKVVTKALVVAPNPHNVAYLKAKSERLGHVLSENRRDA